MLADINDPEVRELHPADHWKNMTPEQKASWERKMRKASGDKGKRIKNSKGSALYQPQAELHDELDAPHPKINLLGDPMSAAATPFEASAEDTETDETESNGEEQPTDQYGVKVPKKPTPRNGEAPQNRIVTETPVKFDSDEIGIRKHHIRKNNKNEHQYLGMDPDPNPKKLHLDQVARGYNSARNKREDLDEHIVKAFNIHPIYGVPLPRSQNPDWTEDIPQEAFPPPNDWSQDFPLTNPLILIEEKPSTKGLLDEDKTIFLTSRSEWIRKTDNEWEELDPKFKMTSALAQMDALEAPPRPPTPTPSPEPEPEPEPEPVLPADLLEAVNEAVKEAEETKRAEKLAEASKPPPVPFSPRPPQRSSFGYDPVRDTYQTYQTPYQPTNVPPPPPPAPLVNAGNPIGGLDALADAVDIRSAPAPPPPRPGPYAMPRPAWQQPGPSRVAPAPAGPFYIYNPPPPQHYASPRVAPAPMPGPPPGPPGPPGPGAYRELRPAPPSSRPQQQPPQPLPPAPPRPWGYGYPQ